MTTKDSLGDRMKDNYENRYRISLTRRTPVIIRIDGKAFHSFTRGFEKPYDLTFKQAMWATTIELCSEIMGCKIGYVQSDEISLLITDYDKLTTQAWFDYNLQKMCSVSASIATSAFNRAFKDFVDVEWKDEKPLNIMNSHKNKIGYATFDARAFNIPTSEVCNYFIWRQQDATRNSIEMLGRCYFSQRQLHKVNNTLIQEKLMLEKSVNWNDMPTFFKRGICVIKENYIKDEVERSHWVIDKEIPIFTQDRNYIEQYLSVEDDE